LVADALDFTHDETTARKGCRWIGQKAVTQFLQCNPAFDFSRQAKKTTLLVCSNDIGMGKLSNHRNFIVLEIAFYSTIPKTDLYDRLRWNSFENATKDKLPIRIRTSGAAVRCTKIDRERC
jgi:hypothetical protein